MAPPAFDVLLNNIMAVTKKHEHVKGFKFEISMGASNKFHVTSSKKKKKKLININKKK
jgi:mitochondrial import receptor subunit TOM40